MKNNKYIIIVFLFLLIAPGCDNKRTIETNQETITAANDTTKNIPVPAKVKMIDPDSLVKPKTVPMRKKPTVVPARNIEFTADPPTPLPGPDKLTIITPGENGIPLPDIITMHKEVTLVKNPKPTPAGRMKMKAEAITDIQYLSVSQGLMTPWVKSIFEDRIGNLWISGQEFISRYNGQHFINYISKEAFGLDEIRTIMEDSNGNIWFGGYGGISRYDGEQCTIFTIEEENIFFNAQSIIEDRTGKLWFLIPRGEILCYDPAADSGKGRFVKYTNGEGFFNNGVDVMLVDHKGLLWFGTSNGLTCYDGKRFTNYPAESFLINDDNGINCMIEDSKGIFWLATDRGLIRFDPMAKKGLGSFSNINIPIDRVRGGGLTEDEKGNIWVASYNQGLFCLIRNDTEMGTSYLRYTEKEGLNGNYYHSLLKDSRGNLWLGGQNGGVNRINIGNPVRYFNQENGLKGNNVASIFEDSNEHIWFGINLKGIIKFNSANGGTFTNYGPAQGLSVGGATSFMEDKMGNLWAGNWAGNSGIIANRLNVSKKQNPSHPFLDEFESFTSYNEETGLLYNNVLSMFRDGRGKLWFGNTSGITCFEPEYSSGNISGFFQFPLGGRSIGRSSVFTLLGDKNGAIWMGTRGGGVYKLELNLPNSNADLTTKGHTYTIYTTKDGLGDNNLWDILQDSRNLLWFATNNGLSRFDPIKESFYTFHKEDGLLSDRPNAMAEDNSNKLWILSQTGIDLIVRKPDNTDTIGSSVSNDYNIFSFTAADGFITADDGFKNILVSKKNQLWWATGDGVASLDLNNFELPADAPKINLNSIEIEQTYLDFSSFQDADYQNSSPLMKQLTGTFDSVAPFFNYPLNLALPYNINHLTFNYSAIDWASPYQLQYSYLMEGIDKTWSELSPETKADYRNLAPGKYTFKVKAIGIAKKWSKEFEYSFVIQHPWWERWWAYLFYGLLLLVGIILVDRTQRKRIMQKERQRTLERELEQSKKIEKAYTELEVAHENLKSTQAQLIQSEKMASLGELTAGIAHEIQNPLNFVNNFSEVNAELITELEEERKKEIRDIENEDDILKDLKENEQKINHHGKRADAIVKGMLQHSRTSTGQKELTDINALADEYLRLAYHGMRAKDKNFNADFKTEFDESLPKINVIPQDIGRVLLNLINNAFYVVNEKAKQNIDGYKPEVNVKTSLIPPSADGGGGALISVSDNGSGIPSSIKDKIFQPFFTTKPTGQGTGLGLSLSYDIVKAHGGEMSVETTVGEGSEFIIQIPIF